MSANDIVSVAPFPNFENAIDALVARIRNNDPSLTTLDVADFAPSEANACRIAAALQKNATVKSLNFVDCHLTEVSARVIGDMLLSNETLQDLALDVNSTMGADGFDAIMQGLADNNTLLSISLNDTMQGYEMGCIADMLEGNSTLEVLLLGCNPLSHAEGFDDFADSLAHNRWILRLELDHCELETFQVKELFEMLEGHHSLEHLDLDGNLIDADIAEPFGELLRRNMSLRSISISENNVGSRTAVAVAKALLINDSLLTLTMDENDIDDVGALAFSENLPLMKGLRELSLLGNTMTSVGGKALIAAMQQSRTFNSLGIQGSAFEFTPRMEQEIKFYKQRNEIGWRALECAPLQEPLWPHILAKVASDPCMLYFLINQSPDMVPQANVLRDNDTR